MTTPTPLTPEREREVNEVLCRFMGYGWSVDDLGFIQGPPGSDFNDERSFTQSADTLSLAESQLTSEQWLKYSYRLIRVMERQRKDIPSAVEKIAMLLKLPVASRAAALAEVVGPRNELSTETRQKIEEARRTVSSKIAPHIEATRRSERITQEDLQVCVSPDVQTEL